MESAVGEADQPVGEKSLREVSPSTATQNARSLSEYLSRPRLRRSSRVQVAKVGQEQVCVGLAAISAAVMDSERTVFDIDLGAFADTTPGTHPRIRNFNGQRVYEEEWSITFFV